MTGQLTLFGDELPERPAGSHGRAAAPVRPASVSERIAEIAAGLPRGLRPGRYEVRLDCSAAMSTAHDARGPSLVPSDFTPPDLVVPSTGAKPVRYDLDVR